jgi:hypothetical protein
VKIMWTMKHRPRGPPRLMGKSHGAPALKPGFEHGWQGCQQHPTMDGDSHKVARDITDVPINYNRGQQASGMKHTPKLPDLPTPQCRYLVDRVPLYTSSKSGLETKHVTTCLHVSHGSRSRLPSREGSGATTCQIALSPLHRSGRLWCRHVPPNRYGVTSPLGRAPVQSRA